MATSSTVAPSDVFHRNIDAADQLQTPEVMSYIQILTQKQWPVVCLVETLKETFRQLTNSFQLAAATVANVLHPYSLDYRFFTYTLEVT